jgi:divalent metal cation (Fe/Co/Zn/Cd) transporter
VSLKTAANNSVKDASGSFLAFAAVLAAALGVARMDAVGGMIIAVYLYLVAYTSIREASLVLTDACHRPELVAEVKKIVEGNYPVTVEEVRLRRAGPYVIGTISVTADGNLTLNQLGEFRAQIRSELNTRISGLGRLSVIFHPRRKQSLEPA